MPLLTILGITGGSGGGGGPGAFDPVADLPGTDAERVIVDCWDETCLVYQGLPNVLAVPATSNGTELGITPSKNAFTAHDTWANLVAGRSELSADVDFDTPGAWTTSGSVSITGGAAVFTGGTQSVTSAAGRITQDTDWHLIEVEITAYTSGSFQIEVGGSQLTTAYTPGGAETVHGWVTSDITTGVIAITTTDFIGSIGSLSVKHVPGNHFYAVNTGNRPKRQQDGSSNYVLQFAAEGYLTRNNCSVPDHFGWCVAFADDGGTHVQYAGPFAIDANDNLAFGNANSGGVYHQGLYTPGVTEVWDSGVSISGEFHIWEGTLDWATTDAYEIWKDDTSQTSGTLATPTDLTDIPGIQYRMGTSGNGGAELDCNIYGLYIYDASGGRETDLIAWLNDNTGSQLTL